MPAVHPSRIMIVAGVTLAVVSVPLPFITVQSGGSIQGPWESLPVIVVLAPLAVAALIGDRREGFSKTGAVVAAAVAAVGVLLAVVKMLDALKAVNSLQSRGIDAAIGVGPWVLAAGALAAMAGSALSLSRKIR